MPQLLLLILASCGSQIDPGCDHGFAIPVVVFVLVLAGYLLWRRQIKRAARDEEGLRTGRERRYIYSFDDGQPDREPPSDDGLDEESGH